MVYSDVSKELLRALRVLRVSRQICHRSRTTIVKPHPFSCPLFSPSPYRSLIRTPPIPKVHEVSYSNGYAQRDYVLAHLSSSIHLSPKFSTYLCYFYYNLNPLSLPVHPFPSVLLSFYSAMAPTLIPARHGLAIPLNAGQTVKIINTHGTQVIDTWAFTVSSKNIISQSKSLTHSLALLTNTPQ
jgi:hypothetical protein